VLATPGEPRGSLPFFNAQLGVVRRTAFYRTRAVVSGSIERCAPDNIPLIEPLHFHSGAKASSKTRACCSKDKDTSMAETTQEETRRTSDLAALAIYSLVVFLLMLAWTYVPA
jgi:hypothetical protein